MKPRTTVLLMTICAIFLCGCRTIPQVAGGVEAKPKTVAELQAERDALKKALADKDAEIVQAQISERRAGCRRLEWILGALAALAGAGAYFLPLARSKLLIFGVILAALIPAMAFIARLAPYWEWIGAGVILLGAVIVFILWRREHKGFAGAVEALQALRGQSEDRWKRDIAPVLAETMDKSKGLVDKLISRLPAVPKAG